MTNQCDRKTVPRRPRRHDDLPGLDGLTLAKLREVARREGVNVRGLRRKGQVIDRLRSEGLRRFQWRKVPPPISKDADPPVPFDSWSMLDYMSRWGRHHAHKLTHFPHDQRGAVAVFLGQLIDEGLVRAIPESWSSHLWDDGEVFFILTDEGWTWVDRQTARDTKLAVEQLEVAAGGQHKPEIWRLARWFARVTNGVLRGDVLRKVSGLRSRRTAGEKSEREYEVYSVIDKRPNHADALRAALTG